MQDTEPRNKETSRRHVEHFTATKPDHVVAYVKETPRTGCLPTRTVTTWVGDHLGTVIRYGLPQHDAFGSRRRKLEVMAINGRLYWGWHYYDAQDCINLRAYKGK